MFLIIKSRLKFDHQEVCRVPMNAALTYRKIKSLFLKSDGGSKPNRLARTTNGECLALPRSAILQATLPSHSSRDLT
jgi:hypothetical protein